MQPYGSRPGAIEWTLPNVLPGICQLFLHVEAEPPVNPIQLTSWQRISLGEDVLHLFRVQMVLATRQATHARLEAIFFDEPTLDQMDALLEFATRLEKLGLPAIVSGQF